MIRIFTQAFFDIVMKNTQTLFDTLLNSLVVQFDSLSSYPFITDKRIQEFSFTASQVKNAGIRFNN